MKHGEWHGAPGALALLWAVGCAGASDEGVAERVSQDDSVDEPASRDEPRGSDGPETPDLPADVGATDDDDETPDLPADDDEIETPADAAPDLPVERPSDVPDVSCDVDPTPCGGDVAGTWYVADCPLELQGRVDLSGFGLGCLDAEIESGVLRVSGTWTADSGNLTDTTTTEGEQQFELGPECLNIAGTLVTCDRMGPPIASSLGYSTLECVETDPGGCLCRGTFAQQGSLGIISASAAGRGSYTVDGNTLTTSAVEVSGYEHCVDGEQMVLTTREPGKVGTVVGAIVLVKQ